MKCKKCKTRKPFDAFPKRKDVSSGRRAVCTECYLEGIKQKRKK